MSLVWVKLITWVVFGIFTLVGSILMVYFGPNLLYFFRAAFSDRPPSGRPPTKKSLRLWVLFWVSVSLTILTSAIGSSLPDSLPNPALTAPAPLETLMPTYIPTFPTEAPTFTLTYTPTPTATWTPSFTPTPSKTFTPLPSKTPTITPLPPATYGGLYFGCIPTTYWYFDPSINQDAGYCWDLKNWGLFAEDKSFRINIDGLPPLEKVIFMNIPKSKTVDITFSSIVRTISGISGTSSSRFAIGICSPNSYRTKHAFVYYSLYEGKEPTITIVINGYDPVSNYYYEYNGAKQDLSFSVNSNDLSIGIGNNKNIVSQFIDRTNYTALCLYYYVPEGGKLDAGIENIFIQGK